MWDLSTKQLYQKVLLMHGSAYALGVAVIAATLIVTGWLLMQWVSVASDDYSLVIAASEPGGCNCRKCYQDINECSIECREDCEDYIAKQVVKKHGGVIRDYNAQLDDAVKDTPFAAHANYYKKKERRMYDEAYDGWGTPPSATEQDRAVFNRFVTFTQ